MSGAAVTIVVHEHKRLGRGIALAALAEQLRAAGIGLEFLTGRSGRGRSMMLGPHVRGWITLLVRCFCALCPAWVVDDG
ncbi:MAG TPA: hypothetical protein VED20_06550 [Streptosporangiaceae bacterium]|nr:hypothetical protein [Streptosporangiaceae bacterium]